MQILRGAKLSCVVPSDAAIITILSSRMIPKQNISSCLRLAVIIGEKALVQHYIKEGVLLSPSASRTTTLPSCISPPPSGLFIRILDYINLLIEDVYELAARNGPGSTHLIPSISHSLACISSRHYC